MKNSVDNLPRAAVLVGPHGVVGFQALTGIETETRADATAFLQRLVPAMMALDAAFALPVSPAAK